MNLINFVIQVLRAHMNTPSCDARLFFFLLLLLCFFDLALVFELQGFVFGTGTYMDEHTRPTLREALVISGAWPVPITSR